MYSPIFDASEFPPLRRVKPLPKRRRSTSGDQLLAPDDHAVAQFVPDANVTLPPDMWVKAPHYPSAQAQDDADLTHLFHPDNHDDRPSEYPGGFAIPVGPVDDDDNGDGDYVDHLQQPGNTKKRKVPAAHSTADLLSSPVALEEAEGGGRGHGDKETSDTASALPPSAPSLATVRQRYSPATLAGLQHKELLKTRKQQLAAVLGALSHGDTLALEQALSARYANLAASAGKENIPYDRIRKKPVRRKPASWAHLRSPEKNAVVLRSADFTFSFPSPTAERLISTREEVAILHARFEAELARQGAKAAEMARQNALAAQSGLSHKRERTQQRARMSAGTGAGNATDTAATKVSQSKKKKRSTLANASNPHHLRNYVPSRLPHSGTAAAGQGATALNLVSALPVRFLTAEIPRRRSKKTTTTGPLTVLLQPEDEWICPLCEYSLFYGEETAFRRAIRNRKKILIRRRRARERAAAAASGQKPGVAPMDKTTMSETFEPTLEELTEAAAAVGTAVGRPGAGGTRKERDKAGTCI